MVDMKELNIVVVWSGDHSVILSKIDWYSILDILKDNNITVNNIWPEKQLKQNIESSTAIEGVHIKL